METGRQRQASFRRPHGPCQKQRSESIKRICFPKIRPRNTEINLLSWDPAEKQGCSSCLCTVGIAFESRRRPLSFSREPSPRWQHQKKMFSPQVRLTPDERAPTLVLRMLLLEAFWVAGSDKFRWYRSFPFLEGGCTRRVPAYQRLWEGFWKQQQQNSIFPNSVFHSVICLTNNFRMCQAFF